MPETYGSFCIDTALNNISSFHETYFVEDKKHEFYGVVTGNFPEEGPNQYWDTIQWKISDFLFDRFKPRADFNHQAINLTVSFNSVSPDCFYEKWDFENGDIKFGNQVSYTYPKEGTYYVKLTTCNRNMACDTLTKSVIVGRFVSAKPDFSTEIKIYPNPVLTTLHIEGVTGAYSIKLFDLTGKENLSIRKLNKNLIDVSKLARGLYILEIETKGDKLHYKVFKR